MALSTRHRMNVGAATAAIVAPMARRPVTGGLANHRFKVPTTAIHTLPLLVRAEALDTPQAFGFLDRASDLGDGDGSGRAIPRDCPKRQRRLPEGNRR